MGVHLGVWQKVRVTVVLAIAFSSEHADTMLLSAMYLAVGRSLHISPSQLGTLSMWRGLVTALCSPFAGIIGNIYNRLHLVAIGTVLWGTMALGMGFSRDYTEAAVWIAMNGVGLALVMPCAQSIMAEAFPSEERGRAFGMLFTLSAFGGMLANFCAITFSGRQLGRAEGWRVMFYAVACVAALATLAVLLLGIEPRNLKPKQVEPDSPRRRTVLQIIGGGLMLILRNTWQVFRIRSFQVILLASIVGTVAFVGGMGYRIMYFQLLGFSAVATATMTTCTTVGVAVGFVMGGAAGDALALKFPNASRPFINQLSMALAGPLSVVLFKAMPGDSYHASGVPGSQDHLLWQYCLVEFFIGALGCFPVANNAALFAEIVPESIRTSVYAFDRCITGAIGAAFTPLAGVLAERVFGFKASPHHSAGAPPPPATGAAHAAYQAHEYSTNVLNARALESGLVWTMVVPMIIKFCIYFLLYWTLPKDRVAAVAEEEPDLDGREGDVEEGSKGKGTPQHMRISPPLPFEAEEAESVVGRPGPAVGVPTSPALRRSTSGLGLGREGSLPASARQALAAQVLQVAHADNRSQSLGGERAQRAASLQRNRSVTRSTSIDAYFALETALPGMPTPRKSLGSKVDHGA